MIPPLPSGRISTEPGPLSTELSLVPRAYSRKAFRPSLSASAVGDPVKRDVSVLPGVPPSETLDLHVVARFRFRGRCGEIATRLYPEPSASEGQGELSP
jgi:hypothetical protein